MSAPRRFACLLVGALVFAVLLATGCSGKAASPPTPSPSGSVVATLAGDDPEQALRSYLRDWIREYRRDMSGSSLWVELAGLERLGSPSAEPMRFRADFSFSSNPASSAMPVTPVLHSSNYDVARDPQSDSWVIVLTSSAPDDFLGE